MDLSQYFAKAKTADRIGGVVFGVVLFASVMLLVYPRPLVEAVVHPLMMGCAVASIVCTTVVTICQTEGNRLLRASQLSDALGAGIGEKPRANYYNNVLPKNLRRLAATTLENALFTKEILQKMAWGERIKISAYLILLVLLMVCRNTPTSLLLLVGQTLFSTDLAFNLIRLERFRVRTSKVYDRLEEYFLLKGDTEDPNELAIVVGGFTDYECAKDEAVMPLDENEFKKLNPILSARWEEIQSRLKLKL